MKISFPRIDWKKMKSSFETKWKRHKEKIATLLGILFVLSIPSAIIYFGFVRDFTEEEKGTSVEEITDTSKKILLYLGIALIIFLTVIFFRKAKMSKISIPKPTSIPKWIWQGFGIILVIIGIFFLIKFWEVIVPEKKQVAQVVQPVPSASTTKKSTTKPFTQNACLNQSLPGKGLQIDQVNEFDVGDTLYYTADQLPRNYMPEHDGESVIVTVQDVSCESGYFFQFRATNQNDKPIWDIIVDHTKYKPCGSTMAVTTNTQKKIGLLVKKKAFGS